MRLAQVLLVSIGLTVAGCGSFAIATGNQGALVTAEGVMVLTGVCEFELQVTLKESDGDETTFDVSQFTESTFIDIGTDYDEVAEIEVVVLSASDGCPFSRGDKWRWPKSGTGRLIAQNGKYRVDLHDFHELDTGLDALIED